MSCGEYRIDKTMGGASGIIFGTMFLGGISSWDIRNMQQHHRLQIISGMGNRRLSEEEKPDQGENHAGCIISGVCGNEKGCQETSNIIEVLKRDIRRQFRALQIAEIFSLELEEVEILKKKRWEFPDPGAVSVSLWFQAFCLSVDK